MLAHHQLSLKVTSKIFFEEENKGYLELRSESAKTIGLYSPVGIETKSRYPCHFALDVEGKKLAVCTEMAIFSNFTNVFG